MVDMYAKIETEKFRFIRKNQKKLRVEDYMHLWDAINSNNGLKHIRKPIILSSSYKRVLVICINRHGMQRPILKKFERVDLFISFAQNSNWPEIFNKLFNIKTLRINVI